MIEQADKGKIISWATGKPDSTGIGGVATVTGKESAGPVHQEIPGSKLMPQTPDAQVIPSRTPGNS
jgi:hypothetical protein